MNKNIAASELDAGKNPNNQSLLQKYKMRGFFG